MDAPTDPVREMWQSPAEAARYREKRGPARYSRHGREERIARSFLAGLPRGARVLDVPCGTGRFTDLIANGGFAYCGGDVSLAMIREAQRARSPEATLPFVVADATRLPFADRSFDCVIVWRLIHHLGESSGRQSILREAARVARDRVLVSFHHVLSFTALRRIVLGSFTRRGRGHAITHWQLAREAAACGLVLRQTKGFCKLVSINWFAWFTKAGAREAEARSGR